jgi:hypothetical protein
MDLHLYDNREHKSCHKLTSRHLDVVGSERMNVRLACETISGSVASAIEVYFPEKKRVAEFIRLANNFFDIMNSRIKNDSIPWKCSFGLHLEDQTRILDKFYDEVLNMRCIGSNSMLPFQRGILQSITALKMMFGDLRNSSLKIRYINTNRLNQDVAENAFGLIRAMGRCNVTPGPVDFKYRLRYLCLTWHLLIPRPTCPVVNHDYVPDDDEVIVSTKISPLLMGLEIQPTPIPETVEEALCDLPLDTENNLSTENWTTFNDHLKLSQKCEFGGEEFLAGYIAKKVSSKFPGFVLSAPEATRVPLSWTQHISKGGLKVPSYDMLNMTRRMNKYFLIFHETNNTNKWKVNRMRGVISTLVSRISADFPDIDVAVIKSFVKTRTFIRIKFLNQKIQQLKHKKRNIRKKNQFVRSQEPNLSESDTDSSEDSD